MNDEMRTEAMELCVTACEKFSANNEVCWAYSPRDLLLLGNHSRFSAGPYFSEERISVHTYPSNPPILAVLHPCC